ERALVEQVLDALSGRQLALGVMALDRPGTSGVQRLVLAFFQVGQPFGHGVFHAIEANAPLETARNWHRKSPDWKPFYFATEKTRMTRTKDRARGASRLGAGPTSLGGHDAASASRGSRSSIRRRSRVARRGPHRRRGRRHRPH